MKKEVQQPYAKYLELTQGDTRSTRCVRVGDSAHSDRGQASALRIPVEAVEQCENKSGARELAPRFPDIIKRYC